MQQYIGIDVGGTHVKYGVINSDGEELTHHQFDTPEDASTFTRKWQDVVARCQQDYDIAAIGVSFPGHINPHNGHAAKALHRRAINFHNLIVSRLNRVRQTTGIFKSIGRQNRDIFFLHV